MAAAVAHNAVVANDDVVVLVVADEGAAEREGPAVLAAVPLEEVVRDREVPRERVHLDAAGAEGAAERHPEAVDLRVEARRELSVRGDDRHDRALRHAGRAGRGVVRRCGPGERRLPGGLVRREAEEPPVDDAAGDVHARVVGPEVLNLRADQTAGAVTLELDPLVHDHVLAVGARLDNDQRPGRGSVDRVLDRSGRGRARRGRHRHRAHGHDRRVVARAEDVERDPGARCLAGVARHEQLVRAGIAGKGRDDRVVGPARHRLGDAVEGHGACLPACRRSPCRGS